MSDDDRQFYRVMITRAVSTEIVVVAGDPQEAVVLAERRVPASGAPWHVFGQVSKVIPGVIKDVSD